MNALGRRMPCSRSARRRCPVPYRLTLAVQWAGRLLCWSLAVGMTTAALDLLLDPQAPWWRTVWPLPWYLTSLAIPAWAVLRAREKASQRPPDEDTLPDSWDQAA
ncbi:hypothetical protein KBY55_31295 [Streptomyces sp. b94]|uniref:hypothetical protein n=1 Tax=Streptomyces sp. b94 TaxID=1827634 RepID=UPI001B37ED98|nr:hypothetical protein [Streptomyces sp. b94]MBQ1100430.1 hypothetical protein [Streptomyces sp. b94]